VKAVNRKTGQTCAIKLLKDFPEQDAKVVSFAFPNTLRL